VNIGIQIREIRKKSGWTQSDLAGRCGVTLRTIQRIEKGEVIPSAYTLGKLKEHLGNDFSVANDGFTANQPSTPKPFSRMPLIFSLLTGRSFLTVSAITILLGLLAILWTTTNSKPTQPDPSRTAAVATVNCGTASECDIQLTVKTKEGEILIQKTFGANSYDKASSVIPTLDGGYLILGSTSSFGNGNYDILLIKTDIQGITLWEKTYGGFFNEYASHVTSNESEDSFHIEGTRQVCTTPNVSNSCVMESWKFDVDSEGNLNS
jgi:transcriptional regulator with XRE-family HTH domain